MELTKPIGLLISCATPAANCPIDAILSCCSSWFCASSNWWFIASSWLIRSCNCSWANRMSERSCIIHQVPRPGSAVLATYASTCTQMGWPSARRIHIST
ncbi:hypothetical protein D9M69_559540 [compost metagenome]